MQEKSYAVTVITQIVDRETRKALHEENVVVLFNKPKEYLSGNRLINYTDHDAIAHHVKKQMLAALYARDSSNQANPVSQLREKLKNHNYYIDALVVFDREYEGPRHLELSKKQWMPQYIGPLLKGLIGQSIDIKTTTTFNPAKDSPETALQMAAIINLCNNLKS